MAYINNGELLNKAAKDLNEVLKEIIGKNKKAEILYDAITTYVDAKVQYEKDDIEDKINKTGLYDPDC